MSRVLWLFKGRLWEMILGQRTPLPAAKSCHGPCPTISWSSSAEGISVLKLCACCHRPSGLSNLLNLHVSFLLVRSLHLDFLLYSLFLWDLGPLQLY